MNWLTADTKAAQQALLRLPDVRSARVSRTFWGQVRVTLWEREPLAIVQFREKLFWMDTEGFLFAQTQKAFGPVILVPEIVETERGLRLADAFYLVSIGVLMAAPGDFLQRITTVRFEGSTMILSFRNGPDIWLNSYDAQGELLRLPRILRALSGQPLQTVDLRFERLVFVSDRRTRH